MTSQRGLWFDAPTVWAELDEVERGVVLAAVLARLETPLSRIAGRAGSRCHEVVSALKRTDRPARQQLIAGLTGQLLAPRPPGLQRVDPSWIAHGLAAQPAPLAALVRATVDGETPTSSALRPLTWRLCRRMLGPLTPPPTTTPFLQWPGSRLQRALVHLGCLLLAAQARRVGRPLRRRLLARLGPPWNRSVREALARATLPDPPRTLPRCWAQPEDLLLRLGADLLSHALTPPERRALALRLPRPIGSQLLGGLAAAAAEGCTTGADDAINWLERADRWARGGAR